MARERIILRKYVAAGDPREGGAADTAIADTDALAAQARALILAGYHAARDLLASAVADCEREMEALAGTPRPWEQMTADDAAAPAQPEPDHDSPADRRRRRCASRRAGSAAADESTARCTTADAGAAGGDGGAGSDQPRRRRGLRHDRNAGVQPAPGRRGRAPRRDDRPGPQPPDAATPAAASPAGTGDPAARDAAPRRNAAPPRPPIGRGPAVAPGAAAPLPHAADPAPATTNADDTDAADRDAAHTDSSVDGSGECDADGHAAGDDVDTNATAATDRRELTTTAARPASPRRLSPAAGALVVGRADAPRPQAHQHLQIVPGGKKRLSETARGAEAFRRRQEEVERERAAEALAAANRATAVPAETRPRFAPRPWYEAELVNPRLLPASEPPIPEHLRQELADAVPEPLRISVNNAARIVRRRKRGTGDGGPPADGWPDEPPAA